MIEPKRSGLNLQQDPLGTSSCVTTIQGHKRWLLIPPGPGITKEYLCGKRGILPITYFDNSWPKLKNDENNINGKLPLVIECIQYPGETMFIPGGWWYAVLNLGDTISIKEKFCNIANFDRVWYNMRKYRKVLAYKWL